MAPKRGGKPARQLLDELGIRGNLQKLVRRAVLQGWDVDEFADALVRTKVFKRSFPGLVRNGVINVDFAGGARAGASAVLQAVSAYNKGFDDFNEMANRVGFQGKVNKKVFGMAVRQGISMDEFGQRLQLVKNIRSNPELIDLYNEQRKFAGLKPLGGRAEFLKAAARQDPEFIDSYQAAYLRQQGLELTKEQAAAVAKGIDSPLQTNMDLGQLVAEVRRVRTDVGPELRAAGIDDAYLALLGAGQDPAGKATQLEQIIANRRALNQVARPQSARQSSTGGFALFDEDEAAAY